MPVFVGPGSAPAGGFEGKSDRVGFPTATSDPSSAILGDVYIQTVGSGATMFRYDGTEWAAVGVVEGIDASGGTTATYTGYKTHTFTSNGNFTVNSGDGDVEIILIGGGGGGGNNDTGGGGGSGAYVKRSGVPVTGSPGLYQIVIGSSGAADGSDGGSSTAFGFTAPGGGGGGDGNAGPQPNVGRAGGSSGGGGWPSGGQGPAPGSPYPGTFTDASPPTGWGGQGGTCGGNSGNNNGGGGGGAGQNGQAGTSGGPAGNGGNGITGQFRTGSSESHGGGGGGGGDQDRGDGGTGGGGSGSGPGGNTGPQPMNATANTGGGGGGAGGFGGGQGGAGGTGICIVRYPSS